MVAEMLTYAVVLAAFSFVLVATARMSHDLLALACVPPVFVDGILDAMDSSVTPKLKEFRIAAQEARNKAAADAAAAAAANSPT